MEKVESSWDGHAERGMVAPIREGVITPGPSIIVQASDEHLDGARTTATYLDKSVSGGSTVTQETLLITLLVHSMMDELLKDYYSGESGQSIANHLMSRSELVEVQPLTTRIPHLRIIPRILGLTCFFFSVAYPKNPEPVVSFPWLPVGRLPMSCTHTHTATLSCIRGYSNSGRDKKKLPLWGSWSI